jgi:NAD(P)-dependent dehydrogenase (short-subunit alcohol dehydrogenase family)
MTNTFIIGGTKGIGSSIYKSFKKRGDKVFVFSRTKINSKTSYTIDLSSNKDVEKFFLSFSKKKIKIDNLVFSQRYRGNNYDEENQVIIKSTKLILKIMLKKFNKNSSIVFISSPASIYISDKVNMSYHLTRATLQNLMKYYAVLLGKYKIRCNSVLTGTIIKKENKKFFKENPKLIKKLIDNTPLNQIGNADNIANLVLFLCSKQSYFITGQSINIDGGLSLKMHESLL